MTPKLTAGDRLRRRMDAALRAATEAAGEVVPREWDDQEVEALRIACEAETRRDVLARRFAALADDDAATESALSKLSAELRGLERAVLDALAKVSLEADDAPVDDLTRVRRAANAARRTRSGGRYGSA